MILNKYDQLKAFVENPEGALLNRETFFLQAKEFIEAQGITWKKEAEHNLNVLLDLLAEASPVFH